MCYMGITHQTMYTGNQDWEKRHMLKGLCQLWPPLKGDVNAVTQSAVFSVLQFFFTTHALALQLKIQLRGFYYFPSDANYSRRGSLVVEYTEAKMLFT